MIPALNERRYIEKCVRSVVAQDVDGELEVLVVDSDSDDGTPELAEAAGARVLESPRPGIPAALNSGLEAARGDVLVRFDAHAEMPPGFIARCVRALSDERSAASVGGWRKVEAETAWGRAVGCALESPFGVGNPRIWRPPPEDGRRHDVDSVPLGAFPTELLRATGGWSEKLLANEDYELNYRLRRAGGRVVFDPSIWSIYHPRESLGGVAQQYWRYGQWKAAMLAENPASLRPRQLAPVALLAVGAAALAPTPTRGPARAALGVYGLTLGRVAAGSSAGWRTAAVLATMHACWGAGVLKGLAEQLPF